MRCFIVVICAVLSAGSLRSQKIHLISSADNIIGEKVSIVIDGLQPSGHYILQSTVTDEWKRKWNAEISFIANTKGVFDLQKQAPEAGSYSGVDPFGIFWSAQIEKSPPSVSPDQYPEDTSVVVFTLLKDLNRTYPAKKISPTILKMIRQYKRHLSRSKKSVGL